MNSSIYVAPNIVRESHHGYSLIPMQDEMLEKRELMLVGEIDAAAINSLIAQLIYLSREDPEKEIVIYINSPGGEVSSGLALYDVMQAVSCPVRTVCTGIAASMAAIIFAAGNKREMLPHSRVMVHDPLVRSAGGSALEVSALAEDLMRTRKSIAEILSKHTGKSVREIYKVTAKDTFFTADKAVEFGLADSVLEKI